jgi:hypothetical protein
VKFSEDWKLVVAINAHAKGNLTNVRKYFRLVQLSLEDTRYGWPATAAHQGTVTVDKHIWSGRKIDTDEITSERLSVRDVSSARLAYGPTDIFRRNERICKPFGQMCGYFVRFCRKSRRLLSFKCISLASVRR